MVTLGYRVRSGRVHAWRRWWFAHAENLGAANDAGTLGSRLAVLHLNRLCVFDVCFGTTPDAVFLHCLPPHVLSNYRLTRKNQADNPYVNRFTTASLRFCGFRYSR